MEAFTDYGAGFEWQTTACRYCRVIIGWGEPFELGVLGGVPEWVIPLGLTSVAQQLERARLANGPVPQSAGSQEQKDQDGTEAMAGQKKQDQRVLLLWAVDCAERVLARFETSHAKDDRPRKAIEGARAWADGGLAMSRVRAAAFAAWIAARESDHPAAKDTAFAARPRRRRRLHLSLRVVFPPGRLQSRDARRPLRPSIKRRRFRFHYFRGTGLAVPSSSRTPVAHGGSTLGWTCRARTVNDGGGGPAPPATGQSVFGLYLGAIPPYRMAVTMNLIWQQLPNSN